MSKHKKRIESGEWRVENYEKAGKRLVDRWKKGW